METAYEILIRHNSDNGCMTERTVLAAFQEYLKQLEPHPTVNEEVYAVVPCSERLPEFDQKCVVLDTYGGWHDAVYVGFCNGKPRFRQNIYSRPYMFSNAVSWLEKKTIPFSVTT